MGADTVINGAPVEELLKLRVVTIKRNSVSNWLKILHPNTPVQEVLNLNDALNLIKSGNADVIVEDGAAIYPDMVSLASLRIGVRPVPDLVTSLRFSVAQNEPKLVALLSNAMQNIPAITLSQLDSRWQNLELSSSGFLLSDQERQYLASLPVLKVAYDPDYRPVAFINKNGQEDGLAGEYWREIVAKLGLKTELVPATSWKQLLFKMASGQADVILPVKYVESDVGQVLYSRPMLSFSNVIVTSGLRVSNLAELNGKTLVVSDPVYLRDKLKALLPLSTINVTDSPLQAMQQVVDGNARAYVGNLLIINKLMIEHFSGTLQIVAPAEIPGDLSIGVTSRYESLLPLINRVLRTLTKEQREAMNTKWLYAAQQESVPWAAIKKTLWLALSGLVLLGVLLFISYRRLRIEINQRREAEHSLGIL
ncbi:putative Response regulator/sensor histidine kinase [Pseudomonas savastanoi pv. phaseolicola]|uniref:transporter substrate-binding domain-containing protein n=1 Tax=Pseudomonas savastanoi TaxID=29438 RepID=UPI000EFE1165|nr:putative Response regulator/sensor histidine kinase [Pseudomonas savastanoi pv. phaseolicola]